MISRTRGNQGGDTARRWEFRIEENGRSLRRDVSHADGTRMKTASGFTEQKLDYDERVLLRPGHLREDAVRGVVELTSRTDFLSKPARETIFKDGEAIDFDIPTERVTEPQFNILQNIGYFIPVAGIGIAWAIRTLSKSLTQGSPS